MPMLSNMRSRFLGGGRLPVPVPTLGAELLTNGNMETGDPPSSWTPTAGVTLSVTDARAGAQALRVTRAASSLAAEQVITPSVGAWVLLTSYIRCASGGGRIRLDIGGTQETVAVVSGSWSATYLIGRVTAGGTKKAVLVVLGSSGNVADFDSLSLKPITLASMFSTRPYSTHVTVKAQATVIAGTRAGVVCNLDSATAPANAVFASHDGTNCRLTKLVAGTYTELINTAVAYSAGAYVEIRRAAGTNTYSLWYGGSQVGTNQTISDATVIDNVLAGMFNSFSGNSLAAFSCVPS